MSREDPDVIDSVEKALRLLQSFSGEAPAMSVSEAAAATGLTRATARRLLLTFERLGFAETDGRRFQLTPRVLRLGYGYLAALPFWEHAQSHMRALSDEVKESSSLATLDGGEIVYVARVPASRMMTITFNVGSRLPAYPTSMGRVLLAALPPAELESYLDTTELKRLTATTITDRAKLEAELARVAEQGYALVDGEREEGVRSAAAPVRNAAGGVIAALNVSANAARVSVAKLREEFVPRLLETADAITKDIAGLH
ncbi:IclR family transcriptional regulator domain-containing protein [Amycolatopsis nalaikhensis]|uniref:IclR family transcriptional regulator C-terminal domain-containing protein n=1 Tax=Amycolatopsis nalaikhensis TaxID=715472 RepID=A0ABY8Y1Q4_9PSEU|nr:IclR family transcriptional regulator C-terminal domain-containing protein [Amycolatopsis sp. 2-2]WIV61711.1 IclR family transcriptional regulator C-terminal domain-containing protein [Amycolatopsis sp. 2-2]